VSPEDNTSAATREQAQRALGVLIGLQLWSSGRASDLQWFQFGQRRTVNDHRGRSKEVGQYALHVQCAWRIIQGDRVIVGSRDLHYPADEGQNRQEFDWEVVGGNRRDKQVEAFFEDGTRPLLVREIRVGEAGSFTIALDFGYALGVFPDDSSADEHWRIFKPYAEEPHFVVTGEGSKA
jgi:hypothetical protein